MRAAMLLLGLGLGLAACSAPPVPPPEPSPPVDPAPEPSPPRPLPPSIPMGMSTSTIGSDGKPGRMVSSRSGNNVPWTERTLHFEPVAFDAGEVTPAFQFAAVWEKSSDRDRTVDLVFRLKGLPADALFLDVALASSSVQWVDGTSGGIIESRHQGRHDDEWYLGVLTTRPPASPDIASVALAFDVHRATRVRQMDATLGIDDAAVFDFGTHVTRWVVPSDREVLGFGVHRYDAQPTIPLFRRGLSDELITRLVDSEGHEIREMGSGGSGTQSITNYARGDDEPFVPPVHVLVDVPVATTTTRVRVRLEDIRPRR